MRDAALFNLKTVPRVPHLITMFGTTLWHRSRSPNPTQIMPPSLTRQHPPWNITELRLSCLMLVSICMQEKRKNISWAPRLSSLVWIRRRFGWVSFMYLASGGYSKMSSFNAQILLRGPWAFLEHEEVFHVSVACPCGSASINATSLPREIYGRLYLCCWCEPTPPWPDNENVYCGVRVGQLRRLFWIYL